MSKLHWSGTAKALTRKDITEVEAKIGITLPKPLAAHYLSKNGGQTEESWFVGLDDIEYNIHEFRPIKYRSYSGEVLFEEGYLRAVREKRIVPSNLVPFAIDEGANYFCIGVDDGRVYFVAADVPRGKHRPILLAKSLDAMMKSLITEDEMWEEIPEDELEEESKPKSKPKAAPRAAAKPMPKKAKPGPKTSKPAATKKKPASTPKKAAKKTKASASASKPIAKKPARPSKR